MLRFSYSKNQANEGQTVQTDGGYDYPFKENHCKRWGRYGKNPVFCFSTLFQLGILVINRIYKLIVKQHVSVIQSMSLHC